MTEERIWEQARKTMIGLGECTTEGELALLRHLIRTVAAEAREEGIEKMRDAALNAYYDCDCEKDLDIVMKEEAERLKEREK